MKKILLLFIVALLTIPVITEYAGTNERWLPILMTRTQLESSVTSVEAKLLYKPGKIYAKDNFFFVVESFKGIHVINNTDPTNPKIERFITVPGCVDLAIKGNIMYVDNATDLVAINIVNLPEITITRRIKKVFPEIVHPEWLYVPYEFTEENRPENTVIVGWQKE